MLGRIDSVPTNPITSGSGDGGNIGDFARSVGRYVSSLSDMTYSQRQQPYHHRRRDHFDYSSYYTPPVSPPSESLVAPAAAEAAYPHPQYAYSTWNRRSSHPLFPSFSYLDNSYDAFPSPTFHQQLLDYDKNYLERRFDTFANVAATYLPIIPLLAALPAVIAVSYIVISVYEYSNTHIFF